MRGASSARREYRRCNITRHRVQYQQDLECTWEIADGMSETECLKRKPLDAAEGLAVTRYRQ